jgi:hypothetical protein
MVPFLHVCIYTHAKTVPLLISANCEMKYPILEGISSLIGAEISIGRITCTVEQHAAFRFCVNIETLFGNESPHFIGVSG